MPPKKKEPPPEKVAEARRLREAGVTDREIGPRLGVSEDTIYRWLGRRTTPTEQLRKEAMRLRVEEKLSNSVIAERMGVNYGTVHAWLGPNPKSYRAGNQAPKHVYEEAVRLRHSGRTNIEIAEAVGVNVKTIYNWMGPTPNKNRRNRDYSQMQYHSRAMYLRECGYSITEISDELGIPRSTVGNWVKGYGCYGQPTE